MMEWMAVEEIVSSTWRKRRALRAESGEIRKHQEAVRTSIRQAILEGFRNKIGLLNFDGLVQSSMGLDLIVTSLQQAKRELETEGAISDCIGHDLTCWF